MPLGAANFDRKVFRWNNAGTAEAYSPTNTKTVVSGIKDIPVLSGSTDKEQDHKERDFEKSRKATAVVTAAAGSNPTLVAAATAGTIVWGECAESFDSGQEGIRIGPCTVTYEEMGAGTDNDSYSIEEFTFTASAATGGALSSFTV